MNNLLLAGCDDEPDITRLLADFLSGRGFCVTCLHSAAELLRLLPLGPQRWCC